MKEAEAGRDLSPFGRWNAFCPVAEIDRDDKPCPVNRAHARRAEPPYFEKPAQRLRRRGLAAGGDQDLIVSDKRRPPEGAALDRGQRKR